MVQQTKENLTNELQRVEKAIRASENLRQSALTKKGMYEEELKKKDEQLRELGTTPEQAEEDLRQIDVTIEKKLQEIENMIPFDLLHKYNMLK